MVKERSDKVDQSVIFQPIKTWYLENENEVNLRIKDYVPWVNDWIGVFHVRFKCVYSTKFNFPMSISLMCL